MSIWNDVPGYDGIYQVSAEGKVRRRYANGVIREMVPQVKFRPPDSSVPCRVSYGLCKNGKKTIYQATRLVVDAFLGGCPDGCVPYHRNGNKLDNRLENIFIIPQKELGERTAVLANCRAVRKVDSKGRTVAVYASTREAGRADNLSRQSVSDRLNEQVKNPFALNGFTYEWEDRESVIKRIHQRIRDGFPPTFEEVARKVFLGMYSPADFRSMNYRMRNADLVTWASDTYVYEVRRMAPDAARLRAWSKETCTISMDRRVSI